MKFGVPWRAKGIRAEARESAKEAARRSGMSLDDWLNSVIMQQAAQAGVPPYGAQPQEAAQPDPRALAAVNGRLDDLSRRIEQFTRSGPAAYAPPQQHATQGPDPRAELIGRLDQYVHNARPPAPPQPTPQQMAYAPPAMSARLAPARPNHPAPPALDRALADIAARKQMLNGGAPPPRQQAPAPQPPVQAPPPPVQPQVQAYAPPAARAQASAQMPAQAAVQEPAPAPLPAQDLSGLEEQLRKITDQIETLRQPGVTEAINALRAELGEIGLALGEAVPRHSIDTIEQQIHDLSHRIAEGRQNGVDHGALAGIEHGLVEVRDALHGLTPAESLIGFNDAVAGLAQKIDLIVAQRDPETMAQLESAITTLRGMANHVASSDAVSALAAEVQALTDKVDYIAHASANADALSSLEHRIDALGQALAERAQNGNAVPPRLEALVQSLADKIEQIQAAQQAQGSDMSSGLLDDRISMLVQRLDASDSRVGQLEAIERGLSDVLVHVQQSQGGGDTYAGDAAAVDALKYDLAQAQDALKDALKYDIAQSQQALKYDLAQAQDTLKNELVLSQDELKGDIARTQDALEQVHGTLGELVNRLAAIEQGIRSEGRAPAAPVQAPAQVRGEEEEPLELTHPVGRVAVRVVEDSPGMAAFDDRPAPRSAEPAAYAPPVEAEPEPMAPPPQAPIAEPEATAFEGHAFEHEDPADSSLPPAPQLEAQLKELRAHAAQTYPSHADEKSYDETVRDEPPSLDAPQAWAPEVRAPKRLAPGHAPINPDLPPDLPLEPGSGRPPVRTTHSARIGAPEADFGHDRPAAEAAAGGKSSFIAAARRAAQAAMQQEPASVPELDDAAETETDAHPMRQRMMRRVKSLFVAASIVAIVVGSVQIAATMLNLGKPSQPAHTGKQHVSMDQRADSVPVTSAVRTAQKDASRIQSPSLIAPTPMGMASPSASADLQTPPDQPVHINTVPVPDPRAAAAPQADGASPDITGSIPQAPANPPAAAKAPTLKPAAPAVSQDANLPAAIGSPRLRQAAAAGNPAAAYEVAMRFAEGRGVPADLGKAAHWYEQAAKMGLAPAQFRLASQFEKGRGVKKDLARARTLYFSAARQGNAKAMHNLAVLYAEGVNGKPDFKTAAQWFRDAARHGVSDSQYNLGILYARGIGVKKNLPKSYEWFAIAAKHGDKEAAKKRDEIAQHLDAKALAASRRAVAQFVPAPQPKRATTVAPPPGGWDKATAAQAPQVTASTAGTFAVGNR